MTITTGKKTSEFWRTLIMEIAGIALIVYGVIKGDMAAVGIGAGLAGIPASAYAISRGNAKSGNGAAMLALIFLLPLGMAGCANPPKSSITTEAVSTVATPASIARIEIDGRQDAAFEGVAPTIMKQDSEGTWLTTPGQGGVITVDPATGLMYIWSPKDVVITDVKITPEPNPGEPFFQAASIQANLSPVAAIYAKQFADAMAAIKDMTRTEAERYLKSLEAVGKITTDITEAILKAIYPTP